MAGLAHVLRLHHRGRGLGHQHERPLEVVVAIERLVDLGRERDLVVPVRAVGSRWRGEFSITAETAYRRPPRRRAKGCCCRRQSRGARPRRSASSSPADPRIAPRSWGARARGANRRRLGGFAALSFAPIPPNYWGAVQPSRTSAGHARPSFYIDAPSYAESAFTCACD